MLYDCIIIGGGPAGLNAALVLGRARKKVILFDEDKPRNAVTNESHGFITRDGIKPSEFKQLAVQDLKKYPPNISIHKERVKDMKKEGLSFQIQTDNGQSFYARKVILSTGLRDGMPNIEGIHHFYGKSVFTCPFCDGWELRDRPLVVISEDERIFHYTKMIFNWSKDLVVCTNGKNHFTDEQRQLLAKNEIKVIEDGIKSLQGENGQLQRVIFQNGQEIEREGGGFVATRLEQASTLGQTIGCEINEMGGIQTDKVGRTNIEGVYACGDLSLQAPPQLITAAAQGSIAASTIVGDLVNEDF
ncbi:FAD-dependent oxidoreductase [Gracilibacillus sp. JCM 18860]|uniref:FAD-dependent oxidoreductase n=1 Tax=Gracilibacillus sp. JCM 18860 TaxID=1306159 RepID=UPI0006D197DF